MGNNHSVTEDKIIKVWAIGIDGGTFDLAVPWMDQGLLPNMRWMMTKGVHSTLWSTIPPWTPPAWTSFLTGKDPGEHGILYFHRHLDDPSQFRLVNGSDRKAIPLWRILDMHGLRSAFINIPMTYPPPETMDGILLAGLDTPEGKPYTFPIQLSHEIRSLLGHDLIEPSIRNEARKGNYEGLRKKAMDFLHDQIAVLKNVLEKGTYSFVCIDLRSSDIVQHHFWHLMQENHPRHPSQGASNRYANTILETYQIIDNLIGDLRAKADSQTEIMVFSDHGFGPESARSFYVNNFLRERGWLTDRNGAAQTQKSPITRLITHRYFRYLWVMSRKYAPENLKKAIERRMPSLRSVLLQPQSRFLIDWSNTQAYADEFQETIWINLRGREKFGIVTEDKYEEVRNDIILQLRDLVDPNSGQYIFSQVAKREEIYRGNHIKDAGDIILIPNYKHFVQLRPSYTKPTGEILSTLTLDELQNQFTPPGVHRPNGMLLGIGTQFSNVNKIRDDLNIKDLPAWILYMLRINPSPYMPNSRLPECWENHIDKSHRIVTSVDSIAAPVIDYALPEDEELMLDRLKGLGYLD